MQRRRQKMVEEAPAPGISPEVRETMCDAAVRLAGRSVTPTPARSSSSSTADEFYFIEMNTRIQVEHPVTEMVTGVDLVKEQIRVAAASRLSLEQDDIASRPRDGVPHQRRGPGPGLHALAGRDTILEVPGGPGVRVDSAIYQGYTIPPFYDSMVGKLDSLGPQPRGGDQPVRRALREYRIEGIKTTIPLHLRLLEDDAFLSGEYHTGYLEELLNGD